MLAKSRLIFASLLLLVVPALLSGCLGFRKKRVAREKSIPTAVEQTLKTRWVEKRVAELVAQGLSAQAAEQQAGAEFRAKYGFTKEAKAGR